MYDIAWVKNLCASDLILVNVLSFMRLYYYNLKYDDVAKNIILNPADVDGITKIVITLRTRDNNNFTMSPFYIADDEAILFKNKMIEYFTDYKKRGGVNKNG